MSYKLPRSQRDRILSILHPYLDTGDSRTAADFAVAIARVLCEDSPSQFIAEDAFESLYVSGGYGYSEDNKANARGWFRDGFFAKEHTLALTEQEDRALARVEVLGMVPDYPIFIVCNTVRRLTGKW